MFTLLMLCISGLASGQIIVPNSSTTIFGGTLQTLEWNNANTINLKLELNMNGTWNDDDDNHFLSIIVDSHINSYDWNVPLYISQYWSNIARLKLTQLSDNRVFYSDNFTIAGITVDNIDIIVYSDTNLNISWTSNLDQTYNIYLYDNYTTYYNIDPYFRQPVHTIISDVENKNYSWYIRNGINFTDVRLAVINNNGITVGLSNIFSIQYPPTSSPTRSPTMSPTYIPTLLPTTSNPTRQPSCFPTTSDPTSRPTVSPTESPTTSWPTVSPTESPTTNWPTVSPTKSPTTSRPTVSPTESPTTNWPTVSPTESPTTNWPTVSPTDDPSCSPTETPTYTTTTTTQTDNQLLNIKNDNNESDDKWWILMLIILVGIVLCLVITIIKAYCCNNEKENRITPEKPTVPPTIEHVDYNKSRNTDTSPRCHVNEMYSNIDIIQRKNPIYVNEDNGDNEDNAVELSENIYHLGLNIPGRVTGNSTIETTSFIVKPENSEYLNIVN